MTDDCWYFAYGSNLDPERKEQRTGEIRSARHSRLTGYRFAFNKLGKNGSGKANIIPDEASEVWGVVYRCSQDTMRTLDRYEGVPDQYVRHIVRVVLDSGEELEAAAYIARAERVREGLKPDSSYLAHILTGARHHQLPTDYIKMIKGLK